MDNLPIDLLNNDDVIAISVVDTMYESIEKKQTFRGISIPELAITKAQRILNNSINIMLQRIEDLTIQVSDKKLVLIRPEMNDYSMFDIDKLADIVQVGYDEAAKVLRK